MDKYTKLLFTKEPKASASVRLIFFPYAGGNAFAFSKWAALLPDDIEFTVLNLPGRANRYNDPLYKTMNHLVDDLLMALQGLDDKRNVFFGHSMGAKIAYEVTTQLPTASAAFPVHLIASGSSAPFAPPRTNPIHGLPEAEFIYRLREFAGTPETVLKNKEMMSLVLPALRNDFTIAETYRNEGRDKLPTTVSVFMGKDDELVHKRGYDWSDVFESSTGVHWFDGGHFFIEHKNSEVMATVNEILATVL